MSDNAFQATGQSYLLAANANAGGVLISITAPTTVGTFWVANPSNATVLLSIISPGANTAVTFPTAGAAGSPGVVFPPNSFSTIGGPNAGPFAANCVIGAVTNGGSASIFITPGEGF